jgi:glycosyltransferase involved in cell wall biosynthesis
MRKIGIDARLYFQTGVGTYIKNLIHYLEDHNEDEYIFYLYVRKVDIEKISIKKQNFKLIAVDAPWHSIKEQTIFLIKLIKDKLDLMHFTYFGYPIFYNRPFVATVHDLTPLNYKTGASSTLSPILYKIKHFFLKIILKIQIKFARYIFTPTHYVKSQVLNKYGKDLNSKIIVTHEGLSYDLIDNTDDIASLNLPAKYFLYVGNFYPHKNVETLIRAFRHCRFKDTKLVLVGPNNLFSDELNNNLSEKDRANIIFLSNISNKLMPKIYSNALALINPSFSEGFGLPIVEAIHFECPVIASHIPAFIEILGENGNFFDPNDDLALADKMKNFNNKIVHLDNTFSFKHLTDKTFERYQDVLTNENR